MIYSVTGNIIHRGSDMVVVECGGIGFYVNTTLTTLSALSSKTSATLYTHLAVREDDLSLYGFATYDELNAFELLTSVSGVGPKAGLAILSVLTPQSFALAVATGDSKAFTKAKGVGPKVAQRITLELKDKVSKETELLGENADVSFDTDGFPNAEQALLALVTLGYTQSEAATAVAKLDKDLSVEELIKGGLKVLSGN
ncbi:MAG: Holliday junction branch migration protein RuvA [Ruminococcus sp.]|nr:Holliday junction branch migration protein RuvA [Ruminococcus sp.]